MQSRTLASRRIGDRTIEAVLGDMTAESVDAIVNAANSHLAHGGGLAGAIVQHGGEIIQQESRRVAPVPVGEAASTGAGALPCTWVIHAVGPRWGEGGEEAKLRSAVRSSLEEGDRLGARSIALPAISTGIFGYPKVEGTRHIVGEVAAWLRSHNDTSVKLVRLIAFDAFTAELFSSALVEQIVTPAR